jgi:hypothetical protein
MWLTGRRGEGRRMSGLLMFEMETEGSEGEGREE